jgi:chromosome partitioning protein
MEVHMGTVAAFAPRRLGRTIMVFAPKGGVGKTTISAHILVSAAKAGFKALGIDFDPQHSLKLWTEAREQHPMAQHLPMYDSATADLGEWLSVWDHVSHYDLTVIDMPPGIVGQEASVFSIAGRVDYVLMPTQQGELDLMHMIPWMGRFRERGISAVFVMNKVTAPHFTSLKQAKAKLVQHGVVIPVDLPMREDIIQSGCGIATSDHAKMRGNAEFEILWNHVRREIGL